MEQKKAGWLRRCAAIVGDEPCRNLATYRLIRFDGEWLYETQGTGRRQYCRLHARAYARALNLADAFRRENISPAAARPSPISERG